MRHAEVETAARIKAEKERAASEIETARAQAQRVAAEKEAARVEAEKKARDLVAARDEAKRAAALAEAEKAAAIAEAERAAQAEADRVAQVKAWGSQGGGERAELTKSGVEKLKAFWAGQGWKLDEYKPNDTGNKTKIEKAAKELNVSTSTIRRWLRFMFPEKTRKRQRRPRSSAAPK
jgi:hypothetical protein